MGNDGSRVLDLGRIEDKISACQLIEKKGLIFSNIDCPVYGPVNYVQYNGMQFYLG